LPANRAAYWYVLDGAKEYIDVAVCPIILQQQYFDILHVDIGSDVTPPAIPRRDVGRYRSPTLWY
jgi:hypothetical protein